MVRRPVIFLLMIVFVAFFASIAGVGAQEETIILKHKDAFNNLQRPAVEFSHEKHAQQYPDCTECHHVYEFKDGKKVNTWSGEEQLCSECHKSKEEGRTPNLMNAFHENCTGCHRQLAKEGGKTGPVTCGECHVRNEKK